MLCSFCCVPEMVLCRLKSLLQPTRHCKRALERDGAAASNCERWPLQNTLLETGWRDLEIHAYVYMCYAFGRRHSKG
jgi:hypothetical protein